MTPKSQSQSRVWDRLGKRRHEVQRHDANQEQSRDHERDRGGRLANALAGATVESVVGLVIKGSVMTIDAISIQPPGAFHLSGRPFLRSPHGARNDALLQQFSALANPFRVQRW